MDIDKRIARLERQNMIMKIVLAVAVLVGAGVAAAPTSSTLLLESPNKKYRVLIKATDTTAGIWVSGDETGSVGALVNDQKTGAVVGVYGPKVDNKDWTSMSAAITANKESGGYLMLSTPEQSDHKFITGK